MRTVMPYREVTTRSITLPHRGISWVGVIKRNQLQCNRVHPLPCVHSAMKTLDEPMSSVCKAREMLANNQCFGKVCEREGSDCSPVQRHASAGSQNAKMFSTDAVSMYVESICCKYDVRRMTVCISTRSTRLSAREAALPVVLLEESHQLVGLLVHEGTLDGPVCCSNSAALDWSFLSDGIKKFACSGMNASATLHCKGDKYKGRGVHVVFVFLKLHLVS